MTPENPQTGQKLLPMEYYNKLPRENFVEFRDLVILECGITIDTFYRWLRNPEKIKKSNRAVINRIAKQELCYE